MLRPLIESRGKRAILVGINEYDEFSKLSGCVADVSKMERLLRDRFGFEPNHIDILCDTKATRLGIDRALARFLDSVQPDDVAVFYFAGHGGLLQIADEHGELQTFDTLLPKDASRMPGRFRDITQVELRAFLQDLTARTRHACVVLDCCHCGTPFRAEAFASWRRTPAFRPEAGVLSSTLTEALLRSRTESTRHPLWVPSDAYTLLLACQSSEGAAEFELFDALGRSLGPHGAFTWHLTEILARSHGVLTYRDLMARLRIAIQADVRNQHPILEGAADRLVFGSEAGPYERVVPICAMDANAKRVTLDAGRIHGVVAESEWEVCATTEVRQEGRDMVSLGKVCIDDVQTHTASGEFVGKSQSLSPALHYRAIERTRPLPLRYRVFWPKLQELDQRGIRDALGQQPLLAVVDDAATAQAHVVRIAARTQVGAEDPAPLLGPLQQPVWAVLARTGQLLAQPQAQASGLIPLLTQLARYFAALQLDGDSPDLAAVTSLSLSARFPADSQEYPLPGQPDSIPELAHGTTLQLSLNSRAEIPLYAALLLFNIDGTIAAGPHLSTELLPGTAPWRWSTPMTLPEHRQVCPLWAPKQASWGESGIDVMKVVVTREPVDLSLLSQQRVHRSLGSDHSLDSLLSAFAGDRRGFRSCRTDSFLVLTRSFLIYRPHHHSVTSNESLSTVRGAQVE